MDRRRFLIAGVATAVVLAGCSEEGPADGESGDDETDQENGNESGDDSEIDESGGNETDSNETAEGDESNETENESDGNGSENETENDTVEDDETDEAENETAEDDTGEDGTENETAEGDESNEAENETDDVENETDGDSEGDGPETSVLTVEVTTRWREPLADATVTVGEETARTDGDGVATFELAAGTYTVAATAGPYHSEEEDVTLDGDETIAFHLEREYDGIEIVAHDVGITSREESDDTIDATVVVENRSEYDTESVWVEVTVYDDEGDELGHAMSRNFSVSAGGREEVDVLVDRSEYGDYPEELSIGSYEIVVDSIPSPGTIDEVSGGTESSAFAVRGLLGGLFG